MKILVVGSKGFIGRHCVDFFSRENEVWGCDVVMEYDNPHYFPIDAVDSDFLELFQQHQFDVCINCSGAANVPFSIEKPFNDFRLNALNVFKLLEAIRQFNKECKFITMSSAAIYGNPDSLPIYESANTKPVSPYGYHKVMAEMICKEYSTFWGIQTCCLRIFSAFGPGLRKQLFWDMYHKFKEQEEIKLWGTGRESRDFIYIDDIVQAIDLTIKHSSFDAQVVNVANGKQLTIKEVSDAFVNVLGTDKKVIFNGEERKGDPINWEADIKTLKLWGYQQTKSLFEGIKNYVAWIQQD